MKSRDFSMHTKRIQQLAQAGFLLMFLLELSGCAGKIISDPPSTATAPAITTQPLSQTVTVGQTASFSVTVTGTAPFTYEWQKNNANISGATSGNLHHPSHDVRRQRHNVPRNRHKLAGNATSDAVTLLSQLQSLAIHHHSAR